MDWVTETAPSFTVCVSPQPVKTVTMRNASNLAEGLTAVIAIFIALPAVDIFPDALIAPQINRDSVVSLFLRIQRTQHSGTAELDGMLLLAAKLRIRQ
nr:Uncharacterised protein [Klebsiella pneumoniae]